VWRGERRVRKRETVWNRGLEFIKKNGGRGRRKLESQCLGNKGRREREREKVRKKGCFLKSKNQIFK